MQTLPPSEGKIKSEIQLQAECFQWLWNTHPETRLCCFHVPNGGSRNAIEGMQLKASGVVPGIPDLLWLYNGYLNAFELKTLNGTISEAQNKVHEAWLAQGIRVHIIRTFEDFKQAVCKILA